MTTLINPYMVGPPPTIPDAPTLLNAMPGDSLVDLLWTAPSSNGGSPITDYAIRYRTPGGTPTPVFSDNFDSYGDGDIAWLPRTGWSSDIADNNVRMFRGAYVSGPWNGTTQGALYFTAPGYAVKDTGSVNHRVECDIKLDDSSTVAGLIFKQVDSTHYAGLEVVKTEPGFVNGPEDTISFYIRDGGAHYEYKVPTPMGFIYDTVYTLACEYFSGRMKAYVNGFEWFNILLPTSENAIIASGTKAGLIEYHGNSRFNSVAAYSITSLSPSHWQTFSDGVSANTLGTVTGLTNDVEYEFEVAAINAIGTGPWSTSALATPEDAGTSGIPVTTGLVAWYVGDNQAGANNDPLSTLVDSGPNGLNGVSSGTARPTLKTADLNGHAGFLLDGVDDYFDLPDGFSNWLSGTTIFIAMKSGTVTTGGKPLSFSNGPDNRIISFSRFGSGSEVLWFQTNSSNGTRYFGSSAGALVVNEFDIFSAHIPAGAADAAVTGSIRKNNVQIGSGDAYVPPIATRTLNYIGRSPYGSDGYFAGTIYEIAVYNTALSDTDRDLVYNYLTEKYEGVAPTVPGAPTSLDAVAGNAQAVLTWTAPASNGGAAITDYIVQYRTTAGPGSWQTFSDGTSATTGATVTGLTNGTSYDFQVAAVNSAGTGAYSATDSATPAAVVTVPGAPTSLDAVSGNAQATLTWTAPGNNGGAAITDYVVQWRTTAGPGSWNTFSDGTSTATSATVTGLTNGTSYDFQVAAVNSAGTGAYSATDTETPLEPISVNFVNVGARVLAGTTTLAIPYPASLAANDQILACRIGWHTTTTYTNETGWTSLGSRNGGTGTANDSHTTGVRVDRKDSVAGTETGTVTFDQGGTVGGMAGIMAAYRKTPSIATWDVVSVHGTDDTHAANRSVTADQGGPNSNGTLPLKAEDRLIMVVAVDTDAATTITSPVVTATGITFDTPTRRTTSAAGAGTGTDGNVEVFDVRVASGTGTVAPTFAFTTATSQCGPIMFIRLRPVLVTAPIAPTALDATAGDAQVSLTWTAPSDNGGAAITDYVVQYRTTAGPGSWNTFSDGTSTATTATVTGLTNGTAYDFQVAAVNSAGTGAYSATDSATPAAAGGTITDNFTYSNGRLSTVSSSVWADTSANMAVNNNQILYPATSSSDYAWHATAVSANDHYAKATINVPSADYSAGGVLIRGNGDIGSRTGYRVELGHWSGQRNVAITRMDGGSTTEVHTASAGVGAGSHVLEARVIGNVITVYINGSLVTTYSGATSYTTQKRVGIFMSEFANPANDPILDTFEAGAL